MTTVVFLLQKCQFSAVIGDKRCYFHGAESMSFAESDSEEIVRLFENNDDFKGWNDVQLFILYDSESAKYLFNIIDCFELKKKAGQCKNFSFQIKLEEDPVNLENGIDSFLDEGGESAAASAEIDKPNKEIERKNAENDELNRKIFEKDNEIRCLEEQIKKLQDEIAPKDKEIEEWKKWYDDWDCYSAANIVVDTERDILELKKPIGDIHKIWFYSKSEILGSEVEKQLRCMKEEGSKWRFPTKEECMNLLKLFKIPRELGWGTNNYPSSRFFPFCYWYIGGGQQYYINSGEGKFGNASKDSKITVLFVC